MLSSVLKDLKRRTLCLCSMEQLRKENTNWTLKETTYFEYAIKSESPFVFIVAQRVTRHGGLEETMIEKETERSKIKHFLCRLRLY